MHLKDIALKFNVSNFFVYCCLLVFSILLSLRVDNVIKRSYGIVFLPLWLWKFVAFIGTICGTVYWIKKKRKDSESRGPFVTMLFSMFQLGLILLAEVLIVVNLDRGGTMSWSAIFTPLYLLVVLSSVACVLSCCCYKKNNVELEILGVVNLLQLIFIGVKLDDMTEWKWAVVLVPTWILLVVAVLLVAVYACLHCFLVKSDRFQRNELTRSLAFVNTVCFICVIIFFTLFLALLVSQLDGMLQAPFTATFVPLHLSILSLFPTVVTRQPANPMWFGLHKNVVDIVLELIPSFKEYLNVSWVKDDVQVKPGSLGKVSVKSSEKPETKSIPETEYTYIDIMMPD